MKTDSVLFSRPSWPLPRLRQAAGTYWAELALVPPVLTLFGYAVYGDFLLSSPAHFFMVAIPWLANGVLVVKGCQWISRKTAGQFQALDDWPKRLILNILGYMLVVLGCTLFTFWVLSLFPVEALAFSWPKFFKVVIFSKMAVAIGASAYEGIRYFQKWKAALTESEALEKLQLESQFQSLQNQLNPHFLFNSLNVLSSLITEAPRKAEDFVDELSNVYRYLLRSNERELATVREETGFIRSYFHLLKTRHDQGIELEILIDPETGNRRLPALALQILVENAVKHNEIGADKPLKIEIGAAGKTVFVRNNLQRKNARAHSNRVGLENLRERYLLLNQAGFSVEKDAAFFTVRLPLL